MPEIVVPTLNSLDDFYVVGEWKLADGALVAAGEVVVVIETTKASVEIEAEHAGALRHVLVAGATCAPGQTIARIVPPEADCAAPSDTQEGQIAVPGEIFVTAPAREAMDSLGVDERDLTSLGKRVVRRADVEALGRPTLPSPVQTRSPATKRGETEHRDGAPGPAVQPSPCYMAAYVEVGKARQEAKELSRRHKVLIGLPEMVLHHVGNCLKQFPALCRGAGAERASVGVTMDLGKGLFVPVVREVANQTLPELARQLMAYRKAALGSKFKPGDLVAPDIVLALNQFEGVHVVVPMIYPGNVACVALGPVEKAFTWDQGPCEVERASIGVAYDHRHVTGSYVAAFLADLRKALT
ncbi:MAG TPA: 2-oxo acid dehydrogenase subunit E2 [Acidimicrobiales bacterium]|nr:2-oxo acid dehydrogenase subunit E2 [Acidimicrobiales bacterium]